ncbi:MAG: AraC family transcriptional regulator [Ruminococcaceae bacterium]|nr:AraC family transcriptional regulator [Oscillospiraceae bacterium]
MGKQNIFLSQAHAVIGDADLKLFCIGQSRIMDESYGYRSIHMHLYYECHLLLRGEYVFTVGDRAVHLREKQLLIVPPKQEHQSFEDSSEESDVAERVFGLIIEPTDGEICCYPYFLAALQNVGCTPIVLSNDLFEQLMVFLDSFDRQDGGLRAQCRQITDVYPLLYGLFDTINGFELSQHADKAKQSTNHMAVLDCMVNEPSYSLADIANVLGYSYRHTARKIKDIYGGSLVDIRRKNMLSTAKLLLIGEPKMTLDRVALTSRFSSTHAMIRAFHSELGITPTEYRKKMLLEDLEES